MKSVINNDCLKALPELDSNSVDLVYLDPPFFTGRTHKQKTRDNSQEYSFNDKWDDIHSYVEFLRARLFECKRVLKPTGSIFLHCDTNASHHLRLLLDDIFGTNNFQSEIIWSYKRWSNSKKGLLDAHQNIYFYTKTNEFKFNTTFTNYSATTNLDQILQARERNEHNKTVYKRDKLGEIVPSKEKLGVPLSDVWEIPFLNPKAKERVGYPTQKPVILLERIIELVTDKGDLVLDPFCGSGTTLVAAKLLGRKYFGIDVSSEAIKLTEERLESLQKTTSHLLENGKSSYLNKETYVRELLTQMDAVVVERNKGIDGFLKKNYKGKPIAIYIQRDKQLLNEAISLLNKATITKKVGMKILVRTNDVSKQFSLAENQDNQDNQDNNLLIIDSLGFQLLNKFNI